MVVSLSRSASRRSGPSLGLSASLLLNVVLLAVIVWSHFGPSADSVSESPALEARAAVAAEAAPVTEEARIAGEPSEAAAAAAAPTKSAATARPAPAGAEDMRVTIATVRGSIPQTLAEPAAPLGDNVSATLSRVLFWDLDLRRDLRADDRIEAMWVPGTSDGVVIKAARYHSQRLNRTITAYRFKATGDRYPSYWSADGTEVPHRLRNSPLAEYEQVTSLLRDRPTHHGMDFKVDVGTPIVSPFDGEVTRVNWNVAANGNCVEVRYRDGVLAKHLHLSEVQVRPGTQVRAGQVIALSGNTGRSTGPHLHYQLNRGQQVVDPIDYHGTDRRTLPEADREAFARVVAQANARLDAQDQ